MIGFHLMMLGSLIEQYFPCCYISTGVEHTVSLLFERVMSMHPTKEMRGFAKKVSCHLYVFELPIVCI